MNLRNFKRFFGPGMLVAVGYMDPGNWATDLAGGARYEYKLLFVILISNIFAMFLQHTAIRLGVVTGKDLAECCRLYFHRYFNYFLWFICEIAIIAMDLAEVLGSAIALKLLFGIPLTYGVAITALDVFLILFLFEKKMRITEIFISSLIFVVLCCFGVELFLSQPHLPSLMTGFIPTSDVFFNGEMRWIAVGILGATVMPHNLYLHSSIIKLKHTDGDIKNTMKYGTIDSTLSLLVAFFINAGILILAASVFFKHGLVVSEIEEAYKILDPLLGVGFASILFGVALLASGQNATITGTMAGQIVMEGFLNLKMKPWLRRLVTRSLAIIPAWVLLHYFGEKSTTDLLVFSQVILSLQLGFAVIPLVYFTSNRVIMGSEYVNPRWLKWTLWIISAVIIGFNMTLLFG
jgi:manganese transport protein